MKKNFYLLLNNIAQNVSSSEILGTVCNSLLALPIGSDPKNLNKSHFAVCREQIPEEQQFELYQCFQAIHKGTFQAYVWGSPSLNSPLLLHNVEDMQVPVEVGSAR